MPLQRPRLAASSVVPLYEQVVAHIVAAVASGELRPGERIPAIRDLADDWDAGYSTLVKAMAVLRERGVLVARAGKGTFVAGGTAGAHDDDAGCSKTLCDVTLNLQASDPDPKSRAPGLG